MAGEIVKLEMSQPAASIFTGDIAERWIRFMSVADKSIETYRGALRQMFKYFAANDIARPTRADLENWRDMLISTRKASTVQLYLSTAKQFFRWLDVEGLYQNIADNLKSRVKINHEHKKDCLSTVQVARLLKTAGGSSTKDKRDLAIMALMATAGLRTVEIARANVGDLRVVDGITFLYVQGKGHSDKDAAIRVAPQVEVLIRKYLAARGRVDGDAPLFVSTSNRNSGARITSQVVSKMVKARLRAVGIDSPRITAHSLRHTAAVQMLLNGASLENVQQVLRHVNINTTMIYNHTVARMKNDAEIRAANAIFAEAA